MRYKEGYENFANVAVDQPHNIYRAIDGGSTRCASVDGRKGSGVYVLWRLLAKDLLRACLVATEDSVVKRFEIEKRLVSTPHLFLSMVSDLLLWRKALVAL